MLKKIIRSEFSKNVFILMTGSTVSQILPIALTPVLTRLFSPEEFGLYAFYMSLITFFLVVSSGRYELAILLPKENKKAINILALCFFILAVFILVLYIILILFHTWIEELINKPILNNWLWFIPICIFCASSFRILGYWNNRHKRFKGTSYSIVAQTSSRLSTQLISGTEKYGLISGKNSFISFFTNLFDKNRVIQPGITPIGIGGLIISYSVGFLFGFVTLLSFFMKNDRSLLKNISWNEMKNQAKIHQKFPKINSLHALGDELKNIGVNSTLLYTFGDLALGFYSMTFRLLSAPMGLIGNSFAQVFYQRAAEMHAKNENYVPLIDKTVKKLALLALPIFTIILIAGPFVFEFVLGSKWRIVGVYAQYLTPWLFATFIVAPIQQVAVILNKQEKVFILSLISNSFIFGAILIGAYIFNDIITGFIILSVLQVIYYMFFYWWIKKIAKENFSHIYNP